MKKIFLFISVLFFLCVHHAKSQGCSDAGFCTMGNLQPQSDADTSYKHNAAVLFNYGIGEQKTIITQIIPEIEFSFLKNNSLQIKIPYVSASGYLGSNSGAGDLSITVSQTVKKTVNSKLSFSAGIKIPTGTTDEDALNRPRPMPYQTGLGTTDIILGAGLKFRKWNFAFGFQGILSDQNKNGFLRSKWLDDADAQKYFESNQLRRGNDALLRIEKSFSLKKLTLSAGVLNIIHLNASSIVDSTGTRVDVNGSDGLTVNITGKAKYEISKRAEINFSFGFPTIVRDARPDGLTRKVVAAAAFNFKFGK